MRDSGGCFWLGGTVPQASEVGDRRGEKVPAPDGRPVAVQTRLHQLHLFVEVKKRTQTRLSSQAPAEPSTAPARTTCLPSISRISSTVMAPANCASARSSSPVADDGGWLRSMNRVSRMRPEPARKVRGGGQRTARRQEGRSNTYCTPAAPSLHQSSH